MNNGEPRVAGNLAYVDHKKGRAGQPLSRQEHRIVDLIAEGLTNREIGERMLLREGTIKVYMSRAMEKLNLTGRARYQIIVRHWQERVTELENRLAKYEVTGTS